MAPYYILLARYRRAGGPVLQCQRLRRLRPGIIEPRNLESVHVVIAVIPARRLSESVIETMVKIPLRDKSKQA